MTVPTRGTSLRESLALATWVGLVTGLGEVILLAIRSGIFHKWVWVGQQAVWMAPTADMAIFALVGVSLFLLGRLWRRADSLRVHIFVMTLLAASALFLFVPRVSDWALLAFAVGTAWQAQRVLPARQDSIRRLVRRTLPVLLVALLCLFVGFNAWTTLKEWRALGALTPAEADAPNVLLLVIDTERATSMSLYGYGRNTTPALTRFAKEGAVFDMALSTAPWTLPSHASMFTGRYASLLRADFRRPFGTRYPTIAERLRSMGYATAGFVANTYYTAAEFGLARGFIHYEDYYRTPTEILLNSSLGRSIANSTTLHRMLGYYDVVGRKRASDVNRDLLRWIDHRGKRPFFAFLNYYDAHEPYLPPEPFDTLFGLSNRRRDFFRVTFAPREALIFPWHMWGISKAALQAERDAYESGIAYVDSALNELFVALTDRGLLDNTIVVVTADHGEQFGEHLNLTREHRLYTHGNSLYIQAIHVPLVIRFPRRIPGGVRVSDPVTLRDLGATLLDLAGAPEGALPGISLAKRWDGTGSGASSSLAFSTFRDPYSGRLEHSMVAGHYHYIRYGDDGEELFDLASDPDEANNLLPTPESKILLPRLRAAMDHFLATSKPVPQ